MASQKKTLVGVSKFNLPARWVINLVKIQEKKNYHFNVIIIFAIFVTVNILPS